MSFVNARDLPHSENKIAVALSRSSFGRHLGLLFSTKKEGRQLLHLAFHKQMVVEPFPAATGPCWIAAFVDLPPAASIALVGMVRSVATKKAQVPFGLNFTAAKGSFGKTGIYSTPRASDGLTCATYIVEIFRGAMIKLLDETTWKPNDENRQWQEAICKFLATRADAEHLAAVQRNINGLRIRPEEVAAIAAKPGKKPASYDAAVAGAQTVVGQLNRICPPAVLILR
jgi:hypothetical protein